MLLLLSTQIRGKGGGGLYNYVIAEEWMLIIAEMFTVRKAAQNEIIINVKIIIKSAVWLWGVI